MTTDSGRQTEQTANCWQSFSAFTSDNDPYGEPDFGSISDDGQTFFGRSTVTMRRAPSGQATLARRHRSVHLYDLANWIDARRAAAQKGCNQFHGRR